MSEPRLRDEIDACVFGAYGTLFDVGSAIGRYRDVLGNKVAPLISAWRAKQVSSAWLRSLMGDYVDFWHVTGNSLDSAMAALGIKGDLLRSRLMEMWLRVEAFPDVKDTLAGLKQAGLKTAILSDGSTTMLTAAVRSAGLHGLLHHVISADAAQIFKPHPNAYQVGVDRLKIPAERILFLASNAWDAAAATRFGYRTVWVNRTGERAEDLPAKPEREISSLDELPALLGL
jgi:2-haloacid dehalogenase